MEPELTSVEVRLLGSLIEKELTTPEYYPLSLNSLTTACNQKSNRDPVMQLTEDEVNRALESLRSKHLVWYRTSQGSRTIKYEHNVKAAFQLSEPEVAALCVLMLRGPQTPGEIKTRSERLYTFASLDQVDVTIRGMMTPERGPLVAELQRRPGQKERRYAQLLSGIPTQQEEAPAASNVILSGSGVTDQRITTLEEEVKTLRSEIDALKSRLDDFSRQFE